MKLLICNGPKYDASNYRGTDRLFPVYQEQLGENHPLNSILIKNYIWWEKPFINDLRIAHEIVKLYSEYLPKEPMEIIEITSRDEAPVTVNTRFLGYDLSSGAFSLLSSGLDIANNTILDSTADERLIQLRRLEPIFRLMKSYFQPLLNQNGLFDDYDVALFCLETFQATQSLDDNMWENNELMALVTVLGIWLVL